MWQKAKCIDKSSSYYGYWVWVIPTIIYDRRSDSEIYYTNLKYNSYCDWLEPVRVCDTQLLPEQCEDAPIAVLKDWFSEQPKREKKPTTKRASILMLGNEPKVVVPWKNGEKVYTAGLMAKLHFKYENEFPLSKQDKQKGNLYWHWVDVDLVDSLDEMA